MKQDKKFDELDPKKIIEEMRQEYWDGVTEPEEEVSEDSIQLLLVEMAGETFGLQADRCKMITKVGRVTRLPRVPAYVLGVINLRGEIISVVDLASLFGLDAVRGDKSRLVIVQSGDIRTSFLVDRVVGIEWLPMSGLRESEEAASPVKDEYVKGHFEPGEEGGQWVTYLDVDRLLSGEELDFSK